MTSGSAETSGSGRDEGAAVAVTFPDRLSYASRLSRYDLTLFASLYPLKRNMTRHTATKAISSPRLRAPFFASLFADGSLIFLSAMISCLTIMI